MFACVLIANRGEIACRIIRTARSMGIRTVAVFSEADAGARHVAEADTAVAIGSAPAGESYLRPDRLLEAARRTGAEAVHPGYGFLSENAGFAEACADSGLVFIGPPPTAIRTMGSKRAAKELMAAADVPLLPGYHGGDQSLETLSAAAARIGYPVLVKASAGGGGKGMRVVHGAAGLAEAVAGAGREASKAFGDGTLLLEKYLAHARHVEVQVFGDSFGTIVHLFERDCSIQRRHQKVFEEAPAPALPDQVRRRLHAAAVAAARAIGYVGAGTVEFLYQDGAFYFLEMNTRLQVEHPVTEMITGFDLVAWQFLVAAGEPLPVAQDGIACRGHAIEARVYAEDPERGFVPAIGRLLHLVPPPESAVVRVDTGVRQGDVISVHYDPMIAKLIVAAEDRGRAVERMREALARYQVAGVTTNLDFLRAAAAHPAFRTGGVDTGFVEQYQGDLLPPATPAPFDILAMAALTVLVHRTAEAEACLRTVGAGDPHSPWHLATGWRLNGDNHHEVRLVDRDRVREVVVHFRRGGWDLVLPCGVQITARRAQLHGDQLTVFLDGVKRQATVVLHGRSLSLFIDGATWRLQIDDPSDRAAAKTAGSGRLASPMPGTVVRVLVEAGQWVLQGTPLMVVEAMKMEHTITAPADGWVVAVRHDAGAQVTEGAELVEFKPGPADEGALAGADDQRHGQDDR